MLSVHAPLHEEQELICVSAQAEPPGVHRTAAGLVAKFELKAGKRGALTSHTRRAFKPVFKV